MPESPPPDGIQLNHGEIDRLRDVLETWASKTRIEKREKKEALVDEFLRERSIEESNKYAREFLRMKITHWFSNNAPTKDSRLPRSLRTVWTAREVFNIRRQEAVSARQAELLKSGEKSAPIAALNAARAELWAALSAEEKDEFERDADEWTFDGPDASLKTMIAEKRLGDWVASFITLLWNQAGAVSELTFYYLDRMSKMKWGRYDTSIHWNRDDPKNPRFVELYPDWQTNYWGSYARFANMTLFPETRNPENEKGLKRKTIEPDIVFDTFPDGTPILPSISEYRLQARKQAVMRAFMTLHWLLACGFRDTPVAWAEVTARPDHYFRPGLFTDVKIVEPTSMNVGPLAKWWARVRELQENETPEDRFRFTHWWDGSERHEAKYSGDAVEKKTSDKAKHERRLRVANGPPKGAFEAWTGQAPVAGQSGSKPAGSASSDESESEDVPVAGTNGKRKKAVKSTKGQGKEPAAAKSKRPSKRSRNTRDDSSDSARSSHAGSDRGNSPQLSSDDDGPEEINLDNVSGSDDEAPPPPPKGTRRRPGQTARKTNASTPQGGQPAGPRPPSPIPQPVEDVPPAGQMSARTPSLPDPALVTSAAGKPPRWVGKNAARVRPFLYALSEDVIYRRGLMFWSHMLTTRAEFPNVGPGRWASWDSKGWGLPADVHSSPERLEDVFKWLTTHLPAPKSSAGEVQQWMLAMGLALRDGHTANSIEDGNRVPNGGPEFLRNTQLTFKLICDKLEPLCQSVVKQFATGSEDPSGSGSGRPSTFTTAMSTLTSLPATATAARSTRHRLAMVSPSQTRSPPRSHSPGDSAAEVEKQVDSGLQLDENEEVGEPRSISEGLAKQCAQPKPRARQRVGPAVPSSAVARHTRGSDKPRLQASQKDAARTMEILEPMDLTRPRRSTRAKGKQGK
ncbi:hypothetical protein K466DRAFT_604894 [Polyporus arcularius HHB13444]|uniref:Uncharacterized protein n=1 Tax=Polyporus arcularius HHB13444 TaxID=1314778 RepID=A0A5C3NWP9_9APHY|nr:hypothetical protein K466DRAFT_604894 [Polyporus arcularius HHB13444]